MIALAQLSHTYWEEASVIHLDLADFVDKP